MPEKANVREENVSKDNLQQDEAQEETRPCRVLVVGGSPEPSPAELVAGVAEECDLVIAVDRGADVCYEAKLVPDAFCGDGDTISRDARIWVEENVEIREDYDLDKDDTDLALALDLAAKLSADRGWKEWEPVLTCCSGGHPDHFLGVFGQLKTVAVYGAMMVDSGFQAFVLSPEGRPHLELGEHARGKRFSLVALEDSVVSEENMFWELDHENLPALNDLGISNRVTTGFANVTVHEGCAVAFLFWS